MVEDYVPVMQVAVGDTVMLLLYPSYPLVPVVDKLGKTEWGFKNKPKKVKSYETTMFGGTVAANDTTTGVLIVSGGPNVLEGIHMYLVPGAGSTPHETVGGGVGMAEIPYGFIRRGFVVVDNPTHPGERPTLRDQAHPPKFLKYIRLDRR